MSEGGQLTISAHRIVVGSGEAIVAPGDYVRLTVADTGVGMSEAVAAKAIEPFFSTKGVGKGTGLGLSMVHGLVAQLGGAMTITSRVGSGTSVHLWLPVTLTGETGSDTRPDLPEVPKSSGTVLIVDDEEVVRMTTSDMLSDLGYGMIEAESAEAALKLIEAGTEFDILITDHLMPGMTGTELAREVRMRLPDKKVLIVSGYAESDGLPGDMPRLTKPFRQVELASAMAEL
jgi:CheY-like chemotaxis protein